MPDRKDMDEAEDPSYTEIPTWDEEIVKEMRVRVGSTVTKLRYNVGMTQRQLAERMGVTQSMLSQIENGNYDGSVLDMLWRACLALGMQLDLCCIEPGTKRKVCDVSLITS